MRKGTAIVDLSSCLFFPLFAVSGEDEETAGEGKSIEEEEAEVVRQFRK